MHIKQIAAIVFFLGLPMSLAQAMELLDSKHPPLNAEKNLRSNKSSAASDDVLLRHIQVMQELKERFAAKSNSIIEAPNVFEGLTQTEAHIKIYQEQIKRLYIDYPWLESAVRKIIEQEKIHDKTHYVFYHSHITRLNILQDFMRALHQFLSLGALENFHFLRNPHEIIWKESIEKILDNEIHDHRDFWPKRLLSVNLAFFGNLMTSGESTFSYFVRNSNINPPLQKELLERLFFDLEIDAKYISMLQRIAAEYQGKDSTLLQIFVPKNRVDDCVYLSKPYGRPFDIPILPEYFDAIKKRHTHIAPILDYYKSHPEKILDLDKLQARIVIDRSIMLNPKSGIKIMRYGFKADHAKQYTAKIKEIAFEVIKDHLKNGKKIMPLNPDMGKTPLQRLHEYRAKL